MNEAKVTSQEREQGHDKPLNCVFFFVTFVIFVLFVPTRGAVLWRV